MSAVILVDAMWGDAGKGKLSAYISMRYNADLCIRAGTGTNAGHSLFLSDSERVACRQLPLGWLNPKTQVRVGSGVAVDPRIFLDEVKRWGLEGRAKVDYRCSIITEEDIKVERTSATSAVIGSTMSGTGNARIRRIARTGKIARDIPELGLKFRPKFGTLTNCQYRIFRPKFWALTNFFAHTFAKRPFKWLNGIASESVPFEGHFISWIRGYLQRNVFCRYAEFRAKSRWETI